MNEITAQNVLTSAFMQFRSLRPFRRFLCLIFASAVFIPAALYAQSGDGMDIQDSEPPPLKILSRSERGQLDAASDIKRRTKLSLDLMSARLSAAEAAFAAEDFKRMFTELGGFHGLMENTLSYLNMASGGEGKILNNLKRFEMGLRPFMPRLELMRRDAPPRYDRYMRTLARSVRDTRSKAVEPLFGNSVVPNAREQ